jgi:hypothetical protein
VLFFPLAAVGQMASLAFLIVYGMVSVGHLRVYRDTGAKRWLLLLAVGAEPRVVRAVARLHDPHRAGQHLDHAARRSGRELRVRNRLPQA